MRRGMGGAGKARGWMGGGEGLDGTPLDGPALFSITAEAAWLQPLACGVVAVGNVSAALEASDSTDVALIAARRARTARLAAAFKLCVVGLSGDWFADGAV